MNISNATAGLQVAARQVERAASRTANLTTEGAQADPVAAVVERHQGTIAYRANLTVVKAQDEMLGELLDTFA